MSAVEAGSNDPVPDGIYDSLGALVTPSSLYLAQLKDARGPAVLANIGYGDFTITTTPTTQTVSADGTATYTVNVLVLLIFLGLRGVEMAQNVAPDEAPRKLDAGNEPMKVGDGVPRDAAADGMARYIRIERSDPGATCMLVSLPIERPNR